MEDNAESSSRHVDTGRRRTLWIVMLVVAGALVGVVAYLISNGTLFGGTTSTTEGTGGAVVLPQNPSLKLVSQDGTWNVENDGNVTMSEVEVRDTAGAVICEIGTMSPGDLEPCEDAGDRQDLVVAGEGPQGQKVEEPAPAG